MTEYRWEISPRPESGFRLLVTDAETPYTYRVNRFFLTREDAEDYLGFYQAELKAAKEREAELAKQVTRGKFEV